MSVSGLTKIYDNRPVVNGVDLDLFGGEIFGLFGPNGSGKSTTIRMLTGVTPPSRGAINVNVNGGSIDVVRSPMNVREYAAILTETPAVYERMELYRYLRFFGRLSRIPEVDLTRRVLEVVTIVGMEDLIYRPLRQMSMGERQRVELARVLVKDSPILFLDEPFNGIDITTRREIRDYLTKNWLNDERCIFFTSHNLLESEHFVDRFSFIHEGEIIASGDEEKLKTAFLARKFVIYLFDLVSARKGLSTLVEHDIIEGGEVVNNLLYVTLNTRDGMDEVIKMLVENGIRFTEIHPIGTLEDVFVNLVEERDREKIREMQGHRGNGRQRMPPPRENNGAAPVDDLTELPVSSETGSESPDINDVPENDPQRNATDEGTEMTDSHSETGHDGEVV